MGWAVGLFALGTFSAWCAIFPRTAFRMFEAWKFKDPDAAELSDGMLAFRAFANALGAIGLYAAGVLVLVLA
jgi:hypothetical protein